jgi:hypothetical protein
VPVRRKPVVRVWRNPASRCSPPALDAQGRSRIYLKDAPAAAKAAPPVPMFRPSAMALEGKACARVSGAHDDAVNASDASLLGGIGVRRALDTCRRWTQQLRAALLVCDRLP